MTKNEVVEIASAQEFEFEAGYPTAESSQALYDEMDYQRAVQAYIWATPMLNSMGMRQAFASFGVTEKNNKVLVFEQSILPQQICMTANQTTPYAWVLLDLKNKGPMVVDLPPKDLLGGFVDFWQRALEDVGAIGPDRGSGGKYLVLPPDFEGEIPEGYFIVRSTSNLTWFYVRANNIKFKGEPAFGVYGKMRIYPLSKADNPPSTVEMVAAGERAMSMDWPKDYQAWSLIHEGMQLDNIRKQDKIIYDFLKDLGIKHGEPFNPDERQKRILTKAADMGAKMTANLAFTQKDRTPRVIWWPDRTWAGIVAPKNHLWETDNYVEVTDRAAGWYQLGMNAKYLFDARTREPVYGKGSTYLASYHDTSESFLIGSNSYRLRVPANVPVANFWSVTVYSNESRSMIINKQNRISLGSTDGLKFNEDGSVDLYFGPKLPDGSPEENWIQTNEGEGWFTLFRFYGPEKPYYDKSWKLDDFEKIK